MSTLGHVSPSAGAVSSSVPLPPAAAAPEISKTQDQILEDLMNEFVIEQAQSQPPLPPLGTTHAVEPVIPKDDPEEILKRCLESLKSEENNSPLNFFEQSMKIMVIQLELANVFFSDLLVQPKASLEQWLAKQEKDKVQGMFLASKQAKLALEWGAPIQEMFPGNLLKEWTINYPLALLRIQEQPALKIYILDDAEVQKLMTEGIAQMSGGSVDPITASTQFFDKFLSIKDDEKAKEWLIEQRNKKDPKDPECYAYPFSTVETLNQALENPQLKQLLDQSYLKTCLDRYKECAARLKKIGLEKVLNELDPLSQQKVEQETGWAVTFFKELLSQLKQEPADPERLRKWIEGHHSFKMSSPFLLAKTYASTNYETEVPALNSLIKEIVDLYKECSPLLKSQGLESYLETNPKLLPAGVAPEILEKISSRNL